MPDVADLSRYDDWLAWLRSRAQEDEAIRAVWVSGSAVTGGWDEWSDLDVDVLCEPGTAVAAYGRLVERARQDFAVADLWELPESTWPDGRQCFVNLQARPGLLDEPTRLIDIHMVDVSDSDTHVDERRHGRPIVLHDPDHLLVQREDDPDEMQTAIDAALDQVRQRRVTGEWLVNRALARGHVAEAVDLYLRFALGPVVRLLRVRHCPWRHDYGLRYVRKDLPPDVADRVESLVPGHTGATLSELSAACFEWYDDLLASS